MSHPHSRWIFWVLVSFAFVALYYSSRPTPNRQNPHSELARINEEVQASNQDFAFQLKRYHVSARLAYKETLIIRLREGLITFQEVIAEFFRLNESSPVTLDKIREIYPGRTDEEKMAANVIDYVRLRAPIADPQGVLLARLQTEFSERFGNRNTTPMG